MTEHTRRFPPPWTLVELDGGGFKVIDGNGCPVAWVYARDDLAAKAFPNVLTTDEAWKIATNIAKLPELLVNRTGDQRLGVEVEPGDGQR